MDKYFGFFTQLYHGKAKSYCVMECGHCGATVLIEDKKSVPMSYMEYNIPCCDKPLYFYANLQNGHSWYKEKVK